MKGSFIKHGLALLTAAALVCAGITGCNKTPASSGEGSDVSSGTGSDTEGSPFKQEDPPQFVDQHSDGSPVFSIDTVIYGKTPADKPEAPGDVYTPPGDTSAEDTPVVISGVTVQADPDDSIIIEGKGFSKDGAGQKVLVYAQTTESDGAVFEAQVLAADETTITAVIDKSVPYGAYRVQVQNADGISRPVYVNVPEAWWISETNAQPGDIVSVYGQNMSYKNEQGTSYVYLHLGGEQESDLSVPAEVTQADPYKISFRVPEGLKTGYQYEVWVHNGHGGDEGWAFAPQYLTITNTEGVSWSDRLVNVTEYGANPADEEDDTAAITEAIEAAESGDTIYFPAGVYHVSDEITVNKESVRFLGDGRDETIIDTSSNQKTFTFSVSTTPFAAQKLGFRDHRQANAPSRFLNLKGDGYDTGTPNIVIEDCVFEMVNDSECYDENGTLIYDSTSVMQVSGAVNVYIRNNTFHTPNAAYISNCSKVFCSGNEVVGNHVMVKFDGPQELHFNEVSQVDVSNNTFISEHKLTNPDDTYTVGSRGINRSVVFHGAASELYIAQNDIQRAGNPQDNSGEQIMFEAPATHYTGKATLLEDNVLRFDEEGYTSPGRGAVVTIVYGTGNAQSRRIVKTSGNAVLLDAPWTVQPDETSIFSVTRPFMNAVVYDNSIEGFDNYPDAYSAGCGIQLYGNMRNFFVKDNSFSHYHHGIQLTSHYQLPGFGDSIMSNQVVWTIIDNNTLTDVRRGICAFLVFDYGVERADATEPAFHTVLNTVIRCNTIQTTRLSNAENMEGLGGDGVVVGTIYHDFTTKPETSTWPGDWVRGTVIEHNSFADTAKDAIYIMKHQGYTVIRDNVFSNIGGENIGYADKAAEAIIADSTS